MREKSTGTGTGAGVLFGLVFASIGGGLIYAAIGGYGRLTKQAAVEEANPLSPWLWRTDWASRPAGRQNKKSEIFYWALAIFCNIITLPLLFQPVPTLIQPSDPRVPLLPPFNLMEP